MRMKKLVAKLKLCRLFKYSAFFLLIAGSAQANSQSWIQKGSDINGEAAEDKSGYSLSMPDPNTFAVGAYANDGGGLTSGHVRVFNWSGSDWEQKGHDIDGEAAYDQSGICVCMPDSNTLSVGAWYNDGNGSQAGHVRIYTWNGDAWQQKGQDLDGEAAGDQSGWAVSMPDSSTVAIGAFNNDGSGSNAGHVRVYSWNGSSWIQKGADINGESSGDQSGYSVSMPDNNTVAIGAITNDGNGTSAGHVRIYRWNESAWEQKGQDLDGEAANDQSGKSVCMPDSNTVAVGARDNDGNGSNAGHVRIYRWNGSTWVQKGLDIDGEAESDVSGWSISMPDSNNIAIGAPYNKGFDTNAGHVRIYAWNGSSWVQKGPDIDGEAAYNYSGWSVNMPDSKTVAIGAPDNNGNGTNSGHVRVYSFCNSTASSIAQTVCNSYTAPDGQVYTTSGIKTAIIPNTTGCDSTITIDLTVLEGSSASVTETACDSYTAPDGQVYTTSGIKTAIIPNTAGCDSTITIDLTVLEGSSASVTETACGSYTAPDGQVYTSSGIKTAIIPNTAGCDSTITIDLTVLEGSSASVTETVCDSYTAPDGQVYTTSGIKTAIIPNTAGCDSTITIDLTVLEGSSASVTETACNSYTAPDGQVYTTSGIKTAIIQNTAGCDSTITINLTINKVDTSVTQNGIILSSNASGATYQWLDCNDVNSIIPGETNHTFTASDNGSYAVEVTQNGCVGTSACYPITTAGILENNFDFEIEVFPNPTHGIFRVNLGEIQDELTIEIFDIHGNRISKSIYENTKMIEEHLNIQSGIYLITIHSGSKKAIIQMVKN